MTKYRYSDNIDAERMRGIRDKRRDAGRCLICGGQNDRDGAWHCSSCLNKMNKLKKRNVERRKAAGLCTNCGKPTELDGWLCRECRDKSNAHAKERGKWRREHGLCPQCGKPTDDGCVYCQRCRDIHNDYQRCKKYGIPWLKSKPGKYAE